MLLMMMCARKPGEGKLNLKPAPFMKNIILALLAIATSMILVPSVVAQELSVCSYNLRYKNSNDTDAGNGWNTRRTYLINFINFQRPDLLGVQEALNSQMNDMQSGLKGYSYIGVGRNDGNTSGEYSAIFYRTERMVLLDHGDFWLSDTPWTPSKGFPSKDGSTSYYRICTWGKFYDKATHTIVYHFNTHLDLDETNRQQSYYLIKRKIEEIASKTVPVIVTGDFNAVQTGDTYKLFSNSGSLYDCYVRSTQKFITNGTSPGFDAGYYSTVSGELRRIDHIFVTNSFIPKHYAVLNPCYYSTSGTEEYHERAYSDHSPVMAKLAVKSSQTYELATAPPPSVGGVYQLSTAAELEAFTYIIGGLAGFKQNCAAKAVLLNDIDMVNMSSWQPIGTENKPFTGTFDGQGHSIRNLVIKTGKGFSGLFGKTSGATIKDFHVSGTLTVSEGSMEHGVVGYADGTTIADVHSSLIITSDKANNDTRHIGGIVGTMAGSSTVTRCSYDGKLNDAGTNTVGGIVGYADGSRNKVSHCINYGTIKSSGESTNVGGILGYVNYAGFEIFSCANVGSVVAGTTYGGQIIGRQVKSMTTPPVNLFYLDGDALAPFGSATETTAAVGATAVDEKKLQSGEVCFRLNGNQTEINWYQTLSEDLYPMLDPTHLRVWWIDNKYTNYNPTDVESIAADSDSEHGSIFSLSGQLKAYSKSRKSNLPMGIFITKGKKYIKK